MSDNTKALRKRKSFNKSTESISNAKMLSKSPTSKALDTTPKQTKPIPKIMSEQKENLKSNIKKRKSLSGHMINNSDGISPKKSKPEPFTGTSDLFMQMKTPENETIKTNKENKSKKAKATPDKSNTVKDTEAPIEKSKKIKNKEEARAKRAASKDRLKQTITDASSGDASALTYVKTKFEELSGKGKLTSSSKRKFRLYKRVLEAQGVIKSIKSSNLVEKQKLNAKIRKGKNEKNKKVETSKTNIEEDEDDSADDSEDADEVSKKEANTINLNKQSQLIKSQIETEEDSDDADEEELKDAEDEENGSESVEGEDEEEEDNEDKEEEDDENKEEEDDEDQEEEDDSDVDKEEEDDSDEDIEEENDSGDEVENTNSQKPKKMKQSQALQKQDTAKMNSSPEDKSQFTLFVGNIPFDTTQEEIAEHFSKAGNIKDIRIPLDRNTSKSRGFAYVELTNETSYKKALALHHTSLKGRAINVMDSESKKSNGPMIRGGRGFGNNRGQRGGSYRGGSFRGGPHRGGPHRGGRGGPHRGGSYRGSPRGGLQRGGPAGNTPRGNRKY